MFFCVSDLKCFYGNCSLLVNSVLTLSSFVNTGVYSDRNCDPSGANHAALVVGFGKDPKPYWLIKNSWGTKWGEDGYMKIARSEDLCGVMMQPTVPIVWRHTSWRHLNITSSLVSILFVDFLILHVFMTSFKYYIIFSGHPFCWFFYTTCYRHS